MIICLFDQYFINLDMVRLINIQHKGVVVSFKGGEEMRLLGSPTYGENFMCVSHAIDDALRSQAEALKEIK